MSMSISNWKKILNVIAELSSKGEETSYFLSADHDIIYFHDLGDEIFPEDSEMGIKFAEWGMVFEDQCWAIYV